MTGGESSGSVKFSTSCTGDSVPPFSVSEFAQCQSVPQFAPAALVTVVPAGAGEPVRNQTSSGWFVTQSVTSTEPFPEESIDTGSVSVR